MNDKNQVCEVKCQRSMVKCSHGFTFVEVLIAVALLAIITSFGLFISFDFYKSYAFRSEKSTIVSVLQKARSQSLNNINQTRHGVHFQASPLQYVIFECSSTCVSYPGSSSSDIIIDSSYGISIAPPALPFDVVFDQLSGSCVSSNCSTTPLVITANYGAKSYNISVNNEGQIDW